MKFSRLYHDTVVSLEQAGIESAQFDVVLLFDFCFGLSRSQLVLSGDREVPEKDLERFEEMLKRRLAREPLHYITGVREFWSLNFCVSSAVLIPRPETEFLLDHVLSVGRKHGCNFDTVLDMCTGSGVIAVVLARELQAATIVAVDRSADALDVAVVNRKKFDLTERIHLVCSDLFSALHPDMKFDLIVANPPYIAVTERDSLQPEVKCWEPGSALFAGREGLDVIERLADEAYQYIRPGGRIFIEIGAEQERKVEHLFGRHRSCAYNNVEVIADWSGRPRILHAQMAGEINEQDTN